MELPIGSIVMWYKATSEIPSGWILCNGNDGSPDLRGKYVVGISLDTERVPVGSETHVHTNANTSAEGAHTHDVTGTLGGTVSKVDVSEVGSGVSGISPTHSHVVDLDLQNSGTHLHGTSNTNLVVNAPPFVQVHYIMRKL